MATKKPVDPSKLKYDQAIAEVEQIIERIESGDVELEESLAAWERGVKLLSHCRKVLDQAEKKIESLQLQVDPKGAEDADDYESDADEPTE